MSYLVLSIWRLHTSSVDDYVIPKARLKFGERAFAVAVPVYNNLPRELGTTIFNATFK